MRKEEQIPTIAPSVLYDEFHFGKVEWELSIQNKQHLFHINRLEDTRGKMLFPLPPHRKVVNDLIFITKGESVRYKGLNKYKFKENQFFFLPAFQLTAHKSMSTNVEGFYIHYGPEIFSDFTHHLEQFPFLNFSDHPVVEIPEQAVSRVLNLFYRLEEIYSNWKKTDLSLVVPYLLTLFAEINQYVEKKEKITLKNSATLITEQYKNTLTKYIYQKQTIQEYAELLFITPNHLNKCIKKTLNKTAKNLLDEMLILESKFLLKYPNLSISEIAEKNILKSRAYHLIFFSCAQKGQFPLQNRFRIVFEWYRHFFE